MLQPRDDKSLEIHSMQPHPAGCSTAELDFHLFPASYPLGSSTHFNPDPRIIFQAKKKVLQIPFLGRGRKIVFDSAGIALFPTLLFEDAKVIHLKGICARLASEL
jgi:hypothetical protein